MDEHSVSLTLIDRQVLDSYTQFMNGLGQYLGEAYELVLHSLESWEHSVVHILHGHHSGRKVGAPITDLALNMLAKFAETGEDHITYFSVSKKGEPIKSTTIAVRGEQNRIIGLLCIHFYMNTPLSDILASLTPDPVHTIAGARPEPYVDNAHALITSALENVRRKVMADDTISHANKNKSIVCKLDDYGIFHIKDAVVKVAELLNISKNTVYMHLRNRNKGDKKQE